MNSNPKTIQIFLQTGDPRGIRVAEITTRIVQVIEVPRDRLREFFAMPASKDVALYFLFGRDDERPRPRVYIGQSSKLRSRLATHDQNKNFWNRAVVCISKTKNLTQTHATYLENHSLRAAQRAQRYSDDNVNIGSSPHVPANLEADCLEFFETARVLLSSLGYYPFDPLESTNNHDAIDEAYCTANGSNAVAWYSREGFIIRKGAIGRVGKRTTMSTMNLNLRKRLEKEGVLRIEGDRVIFLRDYDASSPSMATRILLGRHTASWSEWSLKDGTPLKDVRRDWEYEEDQEDG